MADRPLPAYDGDEPYVFVSYSHEDDALVYPEIRWLQDQGFNIWYDEGISPGSTWRQELAESLKNSDLFLLFVTPASATSDNCLKEVNYALDEGRGILPIHLESTELPEGLKLSLSDRQAILKHELPDGEYREKVLSGVGGHIQRGQSFAPALPTIIPSNSTKPILIGAGLIAVAILTVGILNYLGPSEDASVPSGIPQESQTPATASETAVEETPSIAVLPFEDMSAEQDQAYLGRGIAEELINGLTKLDGLRVASRTSSFYYAKQDIPITTIAENLKVRHILEAPKRKQVRCLVRSVDDTAARYCRSSVR